MDPHQEETSAVDNAIERAIAILMEHGCTAQVFVTTYNQDGTTSFYSAGAGNWYARYGQVRYWADIQGQQGSTTETPFD